MRIRKQNVKRASGVIVNLLLIVLILSLYVATSEPEMTAAVAAMAYSPAYRGDASGRAALEIAVDWNAGAIPDMLDTLKKAGVRVTFALSGEWAKENAALLMRMCAEGHEIATMGMRPSEDGSVAWVVADVRDSVEVIENACGIKPTCYYSGERNITVSKNASSRLEMTQVISTVDLLCARGSAQDIISRALQNPLEGSIILMQPTAAANEALPLLITAYEKKGITLVRVCDVLDG